MVRLFAGCVLALSTHGSLLLWLTNGLEAVVASATGWPGMGIIFLYSFLIAFVLPGPSEVVLLAPLDLGLSPLLRLSLIMLVSAFGKAAGSVLAFHLGQEVKRSGPIIRWLRASRWDVLAWSEKRSVQLAQRYGYGGLAIALSVPFFPDTISIYAFAVLEKDYMNFAAATFLGSLGRLVLVTTVFGSVAIVI
jgi:membrane protein YqaA with SNARE-associated domain